MSDHGQLQRVTSRPAEIGGGIVINRLLPSVDRRMVGAWCFLDHAGPTTFSGGPGLRVGPHPHIGLQTFTWMLEGEVLHRDSLSNEQVIRPGQVNLMTAGRGISHTEESVTGSARLHAVQLWIALPYRDRECEPAFDHYPQLPNWQKDGLSLTLVAGQYSGHSAPTKLYSPLVGIDLLSQGCLSSSLTLTPSFEHGLLVISGQWRINGIEFTTNELAFIPAGPNCISIEADAGARAILLGGEPYGTEPVLWWNFVGHDRAEITQALRDWQAKHPRFGQVEGYAGPRLEAPELPW